MATPADLHNLKRFIEAQDPVYKQVLAELHAAKKRSHWIWFIFPQIAGLGVSSTSQFYSIRSLNEAKAYIEHMVLGPRLRECTALVNQAENKTILDILGSPDDMKFHSCMTLFAQATTDNQLFDAALRKYFNGDPDRQTLAKL